MRQLLATAVSVMLVMVGPWSAMAQEAPAPTPVIRLAGNDRVATAVALSQAGYADGAGTVVVASAADYADALAGGPLAAVSRAPLLLTSPDRLDPVVAQEVSRLGADRAVVLGGIAAVGRQVEDDLRQAGVEQVDRVAGSDRFDTARLIAAELGPVARVFVVRGTGDQGWADAVAVSALAAGLGEPILLTAPDGLPSATREAVEASGAEAVAIIGGPGAVSDEVSQELAQRWDVSRTFGATRFDTSRAVNDHLGPSVVGAGGSRPWLVTGADWPDALAAGPAVAADSGILLLAAPDTLVHSAPARMWLQTWRRTAQRERFQRVTLVGGPAALSEVVADQAGRLVNPPEPPPIPPEDDPTVAGQGTVIAPDEEPVRLCWLVLTSYPPQCGSGVVVDGLDLDDLPDAERAGGVTWAAARLVGSYDGDVLTVTEPPQPPRPAPPCDFDCFDYEALTDAQRQEIGRVQGDQDALARVRDYAEPQATYAGLFYELPPERPIGLAVAFTDDLTAHDRYLRQRWPYPLSVLRFEHTLAELETIRGSLAADAEHLADEGITLLGWGVDVRANAVGVQVLYLDAGVVEHLEEHYGQDRLTVGGFLTPVTD